MSVALSDLVAALPAVRRELLYHLVPESCIETSRIVQLLLKEAGFAARVVPVQARIANAAAAHLIRRNDFEALRGGANGAYMVILGAPGKPQSGHWAGHLAVYCQGLLIDASVDQASRPEKGILLPQPVAFDVGPTFLEPGGRIVMENGELVIEYVHRPKNTRFLRTPAWRQAPTLLGAARRALKQELARAGPEAGPRP